MIIPLAVGASAAVSAADVLHVDGLAPPGGDGVSWDTAFAHLSDAVAAAEASSGPDEIRIAAGRYRPDTSDAVPGGTGDRLAPIAITESTSFVGGFAGLGAADPDLRDPVAFPTLVDADLGGDDDPDAPATRMDNAAGMIIAEFAPGDELVLDGIAFVNGSTAGLTESGFFSAVVVDRGAVTVIGCRFEDNRVGLLSRAGGLRGVDADLTITDSTFIGNEAYSGSGIMLSGDGDLSVSDSRFHGNFAHEQGGGIMRAFGFGDVVIDRCVFDANLSDVGASIFTGDGIAEIRITDTEIVDNVAAAGGAAILGFDTSAAASVTVERCRVEGNLGIIAAAGLLVYATETDAAVTVVDSLFRRNETASYGGSLGIGGGSGPIRIVNCVFVDNVADESSAMVVTGSDVMVVNSTVARNSSLALNLDDASVRNCIVWDCGAEPFMSVGSVADSIVEGGHPGPGNLDADPMFVQVGTGNVRLAHGSPALDAGSDAHVPPDITLDIDGQPRIQGRSVDMGAYEGSFDPTFPVESFPDIDPDEVVIVGLDGGVFDPIDAPSMIFQNVGDLEGAELTVAALPATSLPAPAGAIPVGTARSFATDISDGDLRMLLTIPFTLADLESPGGVPVEPTAMRLVRREDDASAWSFAAAGNLNPAIGEDGALADGVVEIGTATPPASFLLGTWGVWWDPVDGRGVVWATVDRSGHYAAGLLACPSDAAYPPDGGVDVLDLLTVISSWSRGHGPWDVTGDGLVDVADITEVLSGWGICP